MAKIFKIFGSMDGNVITSMWHRVLYTNASLNYTLSERVAHKNKLLTELFHMRQQHKCVFGEALIQPFMIRKRVFKLDTYDEAKKTANTGL
jgi:hypothetical protein